MYIAVHNAPSDVLSCLPEMVNKLILKLLLFPFSLLFGLGVAIKALLYEVGLLSGVKFSIPVINVGNLTVGGSGKTPHVEYVVRLLSPFIRVAILSRGYRRSTQGFRLAHPRQTSDDVGDEPLLYARKYRNIVVAVSESRALGVPKLLQHRPDIQTIVLDDAYQHRAITPSLNILLTTYSLPFYKDWLLPVGRLREWPSAYRRADAIIVTKCPVDLTPDERDVMIRRINPSERQPVFFSRYTYLDPYAMWAPQHRISLTEQHDVVLVCGIARTEYLLDYLHGVAGSVNMIQFEDHHIYSRYDLEMIEKHFAGMEGPDKIILTTEKDAMRLEPHRDFLLEHNLSVFILPIIVTFLFEDQQRFDSWIKRFLLEYKI
jgi:tetraacyldisaccharide 4'-kinase